MTMSTILDANTCAGLPHYNTIYGVHRKRLFYSETMSLLVRKPVFGVSGKVRHKPGWAATEDG